MPTFHPFLTAFLEKLTTSLADHTFVRLVLSHPASKEPLAPFRLALRLVQIQNQPTLSAALRDAAGDTTSNHPVAEAATLIGTHLGSSFRSALLETTHRDWQLHLPVEGEPRLRGHRPRNQSLPDRSHDRTRKLALDDSAQPWLRALGILDGTGRPRASMVDKHRQIQRYVEILSHLVRAGSWSAGQRIRLVDMGCGKGYLTFGAWHLLRHQLKFDAHVLGIEQRRELVEAANAAARALPAEGLQFRADRIEDARFGTPDVLIALHACNTATDDAIARGIRGGAALIVVAPCCHQELRPQLGQPEPFAGVLRHGLMSERFAEWLTDGLRALYLEWAGYETRVLEFVSPEHTARNVMIAAVRHQPPFTSPEARRRITELKAFFGVPHHALDSLLEPPNTPAP